VGDRPAAGLAWLAVAGFVVTVGSALFLARFGAPDPEAHAGDPSQRPPASHHEG